MSEKKSRHSYTTLPNALGELELSVMEYIWRKPGHDAKQITLNLESQHSSGLSTVQSTLERLVRKRILTREKKGHAFLYYPHVSRSELLGNLMRDVIKLLHDGSTDTILSSFVNVAAKLDSTALDELESLIRKKRQKEKNDD